MKSGVCCSSYYVIMCLTMFPHMGDSSLLPWRIYVMSHSCRIAFGGSDTQPSMFEESEQHNGECFCGTDF